MYNYVFLLQILWDISAFEWWTALGYFSYDGFSVKWHFIFKLLWRHVEMIFIQMLLEIIKCPTNTKKMRYCSLISDEYKCSKNPFFWWQLAMITLYFTSHDYNFAANCFLLNVCERVCVSRPTTMHGRTCMFRALIAQIFAWVRRKSVFQIQNF